jgi:hypothetical protein
MRYSEFRVLKEYDDLSQEKDKILRSISGMNADNEQEAEILDRIWKILNSERVQNAINTAFLASIEDEDISAKQKQEIMQDLQEIVGNVSADYKSMKNFLNKLESQGAINVKALSQPVSTFEQVFDSDPVAIKTFHALKSYGAGKNQKGPGEYAMAILSPKVRLRAGGGDLDIDGIGQVELKAAVTGSGGRLGHGGLAQKDAKAVLAKYHNNVPALKQHFEEGAKGMGLGVFIEYLNQGIPPSTPENIEIRKSIAKDLYGPVFGEFANPVIDAFAQENAQQIERTMVKANFDHYLDKDYFDVMLLCTFAGQKFAACKSGDDILKLRDAGQLQSFSLAAVPTNAGMREIFAQMSLSKAAVK